MNGTNLYKLASPTWDNKEIDAVIHCASTQNLTMGDAVFEFETAFASFVGSRYAVMVNSGSSANLLMIASLFYTRPSPLLKKGDLVIVPAISWPTTYYPLLQYGLRLKFVDVDLHTLNYDLVALAEAITPDARAVVAVNLLGNPNDFSRINDIIADRDILLLEDNCESLGATYQGKQTGTFGLMGTYSFFFSHHICTMEGGMIVTNDENLHDILVCLRAHGWTRNLQPQNTLCIKSNDPFAESFRFLLPGYNLRPVEMAGAAGLAQLKKLPDLIAARKKNARCFQRLFGSDTNFLIQKRIEEPSWFGFSLILAPDAPFTRQQATDALIKNGVECRPIVAGNFAAKEVMKYFDYSVHDRLANAQFIDLNGFFIGNDHLDHAQDLQLVKEILTEVAQGGVA